MGLATRFSATTTKACLGPGLARVPAFSSYSIFCPDWDCAFSRAWFILSRLTQPSSYFCLGFTIQMSGLLPSLLPGHWDSNSDLPDPVPVFLTSSLASRSSLLCALSTKRDPRTDESAVCTLQQPCKDPQQQCTMKLLPFSLLLICYQQLQPRPSFCTGEKQSPNAGSALTKDKLWVEKNNRQMNCLFIYKVRNCSRAQPQYRHTFQATREIEFHTLCPSDPSYWETKLKGSLQADGNNQFL